MSTFIPEVRLAAPPATPAPDSAPTRTVTDSAASITPASPTETYARRAVSVQIDELALIGFGRAEGQRIAHAVEHELTRLLEQHDLPSAQESHATAAIDAGTVRHDPHAATLGLRAARAIYGGLSA